MSRSQLIQVTDASGIGEVRRAAAQHGQAMKLDENDLGRLAVVATEAATNIHRHAGSGMILLRKLGPGERRGVEILAIDRGPGIADLNRALQDGFSTTGTQGSGLGAMRRVATVFDVYSQMGQGTVLLVQIWAGNAEPEELFRTGAVCVPVAEETECGDDWGVRESGSRFHLMMADGLGHGPQAAEASDRALEFFHAGPEASPESILHRIHAGLRATRGAAASVVMIEPARGKTLYAGIGNISGTVVDGAQVKRMVSLNGIVGHAVRTLRSFDYPWTPTSLLIMHSDGLQSRWSLDAYPGLQVRHPATIAGLLFRDFARSRDDVSVVVARERKP